MGQISVSAVGHFYISANTKQAIAILKEIQPLTGNSKYVFPSTRSFARCMSDNTINASFRRMGFDGDTITGHGFRATARTILDEVLHQRIDIIEHQLAHAVRDPNGRAYNRTSHLAERRRMMQQWADFSKKRGIEERIDTLMARADVSFAL